METLHEAGEIHIQSRDKETRGALSMANMVEEKRKHRPTIDSSTTGGFSMANRDEGGQRHTHAGDKDTKGGQLQWPWRKDKAPTL